MFESLLQNKQTLLKIFLNSGISNKNSGIKRANRFKNTGLRKHKLSVLKQQVDALNAPIFIRRPVQFHNDHPLQHSQITTAIIERKRLTQPKMLT